MKERILRLELSDLERMLKESGQLEPSEMLNDAHIEPNELVIRVLKGDNMPIRWSALKVSQSLNELESLLKAVEPKLRECEAKATETTEIANLPEYMTQPLMSFTYIIDRAIDGLYGRISSARKYIPVEVLEREQAEFNKLLAFFNGDTAKAEMTMNLGKPSRKETPKEQIKMSLGYNPVGEAIEFFSGNGDEESELEDGGESDELLSEV